MCVLYNAIKGAAPLLAVLAVKQDVHQYAADHSSFKQTVYPSALFCPSLAATPCSMGADRAKRLEFDLREIYLHSKSPRFDPHRPALPARREWIRQLPAR